MSDNMEMRLRIYNDDLTDVAQKYFITFYCAITFIAGNEVGPKRLIEIVLISVILTFDLIVAGNIFGNVAVLVSISNRRFQEF